MGLSLDVVWVSVVFVEYLLGGSWVVIRVPLRAPSKGSKGIL